MFTWLWDRTHEKDRDEFMMILSEPLPWESGTRGEKWSDEDEAASWAAAQSTLRGG